MHGFDFNFKSRETYSNLTQCVTFYAINTQEPYVFFLVRTQEPYVELK